MASKMRACATILFSTRDDWTPSSRWLLKSKQSHAKAWRIVSRSHGSLSPQRKGKADDAGKGQRMQTRKGRSGEVDSKSPLASRHCECSRCLRASDCKRSSLQVPQSARQWKRRLFSRRRRRAWVVTTVQSCATPTVWEPGCYPCDWLSITCNLDLCGGLCRARGHMDMMEVWWVACGCMSSMQHGSTCTINMLVAICSIIFYQ